MKIWCLTLFWLASAAAAPPSNPAKSSALAKEGDRLYKDGRYHDAAEVLREAYDLDTNPVLLFNMARAYDQSGDLQLALDTYRGYAALSDTDPTLVKRANLAMDRLRGLVARGEADKQLQDAEHRRLEAEAEASKAKAEAESNAARRQREEYAAQERKRLEEANAGASGRRIGALIAGAAAVLALGTGVTFGVLSSNSKSAFTNAQTLEDKQGFEARTRSQALIADVSFSVALAAAIVFAIVFPWSSLGDPNGSVQVVFTPMGSGFGARF